MKLARLFKQKLVLPEVLGATEQAEEQRDALVLQAQGVTEVGTAAQQQSAAAMAVELRTLVKSAQDGGLDFRRPLNDFTKLVKKVEDDYCAPAVAEQKRLERLLVGFAEKEARRVADEERQRQAAFEKAEAERMRLQIEADEAAAMAAQKGTKKAAQAADKLAQKVEAAEAVTQAVIAAPMPEANKANGVSVRRVLKFEVVSAAAVYGARPELCRVEVQASKVQALCVPEAPVPGLKLWWENIGVTTRR